MKKIKLFFALFAMLALGVGNAWGAETLVKVSSADLVDGDYLITATKDGSEYYLTAATFAAGKSTAAKLESDYSNLWSFTKQSDGTWSVKLSSGEGLGVTNTNNGVVCSKNGGKPFTISATASGETTVYMVASDGTNNRYLTLYQTSNWRCYKTTTNATTDQVRAIQLYKVTSSGGSTEPVVSLPTFTPESGTTFTESLEVTLSAESGCDIYYTTDDTEPTTSSTKYTSSIKLTESKTIKAIANNGTKSSAVATATYTKVDPTGTFTLHTGDLIEGDYVIVDGTNAMNNTVTSNRLQYNAVTISNNEIVDPLATTIWHIAPNGEYWTIYSAAAEKYAASTDAKNQATLAASVSDNTKWTVTMSGNTFDFENLARSNGSDSGNKYLRKNGSYGFACYASGTGAKLSLYRKAGTKYNVTVNSTTNGAVTADPTSAEAGTTITLTVTPDGGYVLDALTVTDASSNPVTVTDNKFTMPASDVTVTATFKENEKPAATLTLSKNGVAETFPGSWKQDDVVTLPSINSECVKEFVGWSANANCATEPEYKAGDEYTLAETAQTLYAVYADAEEGELINVFTETFDACNGTGGNDNQWSGSIASTAFPDALKNTWTVANAYAANKCAKFGGSSNKQGSAETPSIALIGTATLTFRAAAWNGSSEGTTLNVTATGATLDMTSVTLTKGAWNTYTVAITNASGSVKVKFEAENASSNRFFLDDVVVSQTSVNYSNYSTTCAAAPKAEVNPTEVTATAAGAEGKVTVTYENVNTANVSVALYNDAACTEAFTADWLTASLDGDKNIIYTVTATTLYTERKAYIQLTAPEANGTTEPAKVVIPVTQAGKDKVFASLEELVAADLTAGDEVTVTLNNDVIKEFYIYSSKRCGVVFDVQKDGKDIKIYFNSQTTIDDWAEGGKLSGALNNVKWTTYSSAWQLAPANTWAWANLTYTEPKAVSTVVVSGAPTKTTYVDGEAFDPAGLTVTVNYNDATTEVNPTGVTFTVTPTTLVKGQTSVSVTATFNSVTSVAYEVTGLTVNDIPTKTVAEFIAAGGTRCYLEGIVSGLTEGNSMKYGNFDLTDASGTIYVYGCLNAAGESQKFADLGVKNGDKIKVIADEYELYGGTKDEAMNVQYVSHVSAASITISDITMDVNEVATITATVDPADAVVTYTIKENAANAISLSGNTITALAEGTATITATVAEGATYLGNSVDFTVTVTPESTSDEVVILAELDGKWYAMKGEAVAGKTGQIAALQVEYFNGTLYNVADDDKAAITWTRTVVGDKVTFANNGKYLKGTSGDTNLALDGSKCEWTFNGTTYTIGNRTFLYRENFNFKNYSTEKANASDAQGNYSALPVVTAPVYATAIEIGGNDNSSVIEANEGQQVNVIVDRAFEAGDEWYTLCVPFNMQASLIGTAYQLSGLVQKGTDYVEVNLVAKTNIEAGQPYLIKPNVTVNKFVVENVTIVNTTGESIAKSIEGLSVEMQGVINGSGTTGGLYWVGNSGYLYNDDVAKLGLRTYFNITTLSGIAPRMRVVAGENVETGVEDLFKTDAPVKVIENGQLIIIRDGVKYNVQGQKL